MADDKETETEAVAPAKSSKGGFLRTSGLAVLLFLVLTTSQVTTAIVSHTLFSAESAESEDGEDTDGSEAEPEPEPIETPTGPPQYSAMDPPIIVSLTDGSAIRFLQVKVEVMARDEDIITAFEAHSPVIRNNLLMLFGSQQISELTTRAGKESLRQASLEEVQSILQINDPEHAFVEDLYFTSFVIQ